MKKIFFFGFSFLAITLAACGQSPDGMNFHEGSLNEALRKAGDQNKLVFVDVYTTWCGPCRRMASDIFPQKKVGDYFNERFVNIKIDAEKGDGVNIARNYGVTAYPTFLILDSSGKLVGKVIGGSPANDFINKVDDIYKKVK